MGFFGMVYTTFVNLQMLGQPVRLDYHKTGDDQWTSLARHLGALREAIKKLKALYSEESEMMTQVQMTSMDAIFYPAYCEFDQFDQVKSVEYTSQPFDGKLVFHGKCDGKEVVTKFVKRYSLELHNLCQQNGWAPRILGSRDLQGGWTMVVMERLDESWKMACGYDKTEKLCAEIRKVLVVIHQYNYVHGDVRDVNIMVKEEGERQLIKLVDFDWGGKIGETRYPRNVGDCRLVRRPAGVCDGELVLADHDMHMLDYMFQDIVLCDSPWWMKKVEYM